MSELDKTDVIDTILDVSKAMGNGYVLVIPVDRSEPFLKKEFPEFDEIRIDKELAMKCREAFHKNGLPMFRLMPFFRLHNIRGIGDEGNFAPLPWTAEYWKLLG